MTTAGVALALSIALAIWAFVQHHLVGGRVWIRLRPGLLDEYSLATGNSEWTKLDERTQDRGGWPIEAAVVDIENPGRTAVTVTGVGLDFGRLARWRRGRRSVSPMLLEAPGATTELRVRLEPFDAARYVFDFWSAVSPALLQVKPDARLTVRAVVRVAGKRRLALSPRRKQWRITPGQLMFMARGEDVGLSAYRAMWRQTHRDDAGRMACIPAAIDVREQFPLDGPAPTAAELRAIMEKHYYGENTAMVGIYTLYAARDLARYYKTTPAGEAGAPTTPAVPPS